jgi:hypothetical protein
MIQLSRNDISLPPFLKLPLNKLTSLAGDSYLAAHSILSIAKLQKAYH